MKKIIALFVLVSLSFSCSSSDDNSDDNSIVGTWIITRQESTNPAVVEKLEATAPCNEIGQLIFTNNNFQWVDKFVPAVENICLENILSEEDNYEFIESENKIIFSENYYLNIISKTDNTLVVETAGGAIDGITFYCNKM